MNNVHSACIVAVCALVTVALRFLPFLIFRENKTTPFYIQQLGQKLPYAIMGMLVIYCLKNISFLQAPHGIPEILACAVVGLLHLWKRNTILSIGIGTIFYMILVQTVF